MNKSNFVCDIYEGDKLLMGEEFGFIFQGRQYCQ